MCLVVDFVGSWAIEKALAFDSEEVSGVVENLDVLLPDFSAHGSGRPGLHRPRHRQDDDKGRRAIDAFEGQKETEAFNKIFQRA